ncbi:MAG: hypothetical protein ACREON_00540, partial [Gemmatimonadaceae bacterium]
LRLVCGQARHQRGEVVAGDAPVERFGDLVPVAFEIVEVRATSARLAKSLGSSTLRWMIEK